ncbi:MAG: PilC/PilY family type IV pilus protein [Gammaproteobacteria bacterium]
MPSFTRLRSFTASALLTLAVVQPALADDTEIYQSQAAAKGARPNVLFVMDTSTSMGTEVQETIPAYDPNTDYGGVTGACPANRIYFSVGGANPPSNCSSGNYFSTSHNKCAASLDALKNIGGVGIWPAFNSATRAVQWYSNSGVNAWRNLANNDAGDVECFADEGINGSASGDGSPWLDGRSGKGKWSATDQTRWTSAGTPPSGIPTTTYRFYSANYINYLNGPKAPQGQTRLEIVKNVATSLATSLTGVNLGLMRYTNMAQNSEGGYVVEPVARIEDNRSTIVSKINSLPADGYTPLSETYYEAALYLQGLAPDYGKDYSNPTSIGADGNYISPIEYTCQKNYIVYLTDGAPTRDESANTKIQDMVKGGACTSAVEPFHDGGWTPGSGICMDELAGWMADTDGTKGTDLRGGIDGKQTAQTYMIGFGNSVGTSRPYLDAIATAGGTDQSYTATDVPSLTKALQTIFSDIQQDSGTFVTPSIAVNAFNRAQTDQDLFFSLFKVGKSQHWRGNLKKYKLKDSVIVATNDVSAVDANGDFVSGTTSFWSSEPDGADVTKGGAVSKLAAPDARPLYTSISNKTIVKPENSLSATNLTDALVGTGDSTTDCGDACKASIAWARGFKLDVNDPNNVLADVDKFMGDPLHGRPAIVTYGKLSNGQPDTVVFVPTNDGFLHAVAGPDAGGTELWGYIPPELLPRLGALRLGTNASHTYGLDGDIRVLRLDKNQDGVIDPGDRVWLFFGMRGGGNHYYGLDVTNPKAPQLLWDIGPDQLPNVGQTWSPPVVTRVRVGGSNGNTDPEKFVLIFGGGYDSTQESQDYSTDAVGNRVFMVEAQTGKLLWSAGGPGGAAAPDLLFQDDADDVTDDGIEMSNSIPGRITVIDTNGDQFADRLYAGDMGGRIWRFDIYNGQDPSTLVTGGIFGKLGDGGLPSPTPANNRRFYNAPDVSLVQIRGTDPFYNVAIGSGYRGHPLDLKTEERFYSLRDRNPYAQFSQDAYNKAKPILDTDTTLVDISADPTGTPVTSTDEGWKLTLSKRDGAGEKVLSESITVNNVVLFTTFQPTSAAGKGACFPTATNRAYALTAFGGKPAIDFTETSTPVLNNDDISVVLKQKDSIVGDLAVAVLRDGTTSAATPPTICLAGMEVLKKCVNVGGTIRTFWNRRDAQ